MFDEERNVHFRERFNCCLTTWQSQVASYWQRTSYFAIFESAAIAGTWKVITSGHWIIAIISCGAGLYLTRIWFLNNLRTWQYVRYWWQMAAQIEDAWQLTSESQLVKGYDEKRIPKIIEGEYHDWVQRVPKLFAGMWIALMVLSVALTWLYLCPCPSIHIVEHFKIHS